MKMTSGENCVQSNSTSTSDFSTLKQALHVFVGNKKPLCVGIKFQGTVKSNVFQRTRLHALKYKGIEYTVTYGKINSTKGLLKRCQAKYMRCQVKDIKCRCR